MNCIPVTHHNITPPAFFEPYNSFHTQQCEKGRKQTDTLIQEFPNAFWLCDSQYNAEDLRGVSKERIGICPPFHKIEEWRETKPDEEILNDLITRKEINLLFVGRIAPNKGHKMLLEIMKIFTTNYPDPIRLRVIGKFDDGLRFDAFVLLSKFLFSFIAYFSLQHHEFPLHALLYPEYFRIMLSLYFSAVS